MKAHSTVLCPIDFSEPATAGLDAAVAMAERIGAEILLFHAIPPVPLATPPETSPAFDVEGYARELARSAKHGLRQLAERNVPETVPVRSVVATGSPAEEICRVADSENVSMIVMATRGQSGSKRFSSGSVTAKVIGVACCPVLAVPLPDPSRGDSTTFVRDWGEPSEESEL